MPRALAIVVALARGSPTAVPPPPSAPPSDPDAAADPAARAGDLFQQGRYAEAAEAFGQAYAQTDDPALLFGRAQALRRAGNCRSAIEVFEAFIATGPPQPDVEEAQRVITACREILGEQERQPDDAIAPQPPMPTSAAVPTESPRPVWRDPLGGALLGSGLVVAIVGGGLYGASFARAQGPSRESESEFEARRSTSGAMAAGGVVLLAAGGALLIGGVVRYAVLARRGRGPSPSAALTWRF